VLKAGVSRGFTLVEALVALALMLAGLAGAGLVLVQGIRFERESGTRRAALRLAGSLADELRALDRDPVASVGVDVPAIRAWLATAQATLPAGSAAHVEVHAGMPSSYRITIEWSASGQGLQRLVLPVTT
jgi:prepilin-type N-terminal cleavage/methylation domain-containing protein